MKRLVTTGLLAVAALTGGVSVAFGQAPQAVERSGNVYHAAVCPPGGPPGVARCHARIVTDEHGRPIAMPHGKPNFGFTGYTARQLRGAYGIVGTGTSATTIAIVDAYGYANAEADLAVYRSTMGLPACSSAGPNPCFTKVNQTGGSAYPAANTGWAQEQALDLDMVSAICPGCRILLVQATTANFDDIVAAVDYAAAHAQIVSNSYGAGEFLGADTDYAPSYNHPGVLMTVSTGDSGYGVQFPASAPTVTAVGGTSLTVSGNSYVSETAWKGAGSGCSALFAKPSWQHDTGCANRMLADLSAVADPNTGVRVYAPNSGTTAAWYIFGGTSASAPIIAGVYGVNGATGTIENTYLFGPTNNNLHDVTSGNNGRCRTAPAYYCNAVVGYDGPTGLGTPNGTNAF
jgi:subtilase family serine protease